MFFRGQRGQAELQQKSLGAIILMIVIPLVVVAFWCGRTAAAAIMQHYNNAGSANALYERMTSEMDTALSITVPANDVNGQSNADGHEVAYFARSATGGPLGRGEDLFWGYVWDSKTNSVQEYTWTWNGTAFTTPVTKGAPFPNITKFASVIVLASQRQDKSSQYYVPIASAFPAVTDYSCSYGFIEFPGSNRTINLDIAAGPNGRDATISTVLGQANIPCLNTHNYIVGFVRATPSPCPAQWGGTAPACTTPTIAPSPVPTTKALLPLYVCDSHVPARPYSTDLGPDPDGVHEDLSNGSSCAPCTPDANGQCAYAVDVSNEQEQTCGNVDGWHENVTAGSASMAVYNAATNTSTTYTYVFQYSPPVADGDDYCEIDNGWAAGTIPTDPTVLYQNDPDVLSQMQNMMLPEYGN